MRGNPEVIDYLNMLIGGELAARDQYLIHSRMYEEWGLSKSCTCGFDYSPCVIPRRQA